jgi:hypothetical protein
MRTDAATRIQYASKYASVANYWKKWIGEVEGLKKSNAVDKKRAYEYQLSSKNPALKTTLSEMTQLYSEQSPFALNNAYYGEVIRNAETLSLANRFLNYMGAVENNKLDEKSLASFKSFLQGFYKDYNGELDAKVTAKLLALYAQKTPNRFLPSDFKESFSNVDKNISTIENWSKNSFITGRNNLGNYNITKDTETIFSDKKMLVEALAKDPFVLLMTQLRDAYVKNTDSQFVSLQLKIDELQKKYMAQLMETDKDRKFFPDANSTLRVTYGKVKGSNPRDAVEYNYQTHVAGIMEKYIPGDYEFDVPKKLINLYNAKDFGIYKDKTGDVPVAFTATNHTTGGNSGSPALDAYGNLVGLNFDRQWEGTMSDINYDPKLCRNIMVDTKYILFIIDKFADSKWLINEMKIVK